MDKIIEYPHEPVMVHAVQRELVTDRDGIYVDGTTGSGGHSVAIGTKLSEKGRLICLEIDPGAVRLSRKRLSSLAGGVIVIKESYAQMDTVLQGLGIERVHGILLDLGLSSYQLERSGRGFSFSRDEPLDMRMDPEGRITAYHLVNNLSPKDIEKILKDYGEERKARSISKSIERRRKKKPIGSSLQLADLIKSLIPPSRHPGAKHPATRTFQALRIAVNSELKNLETFMEKAPSMLIKGGRLVILSYHSLEDRIVKQTMRDWEKGCECPPDFPRCICNKIPLFRRLHKKGLKPDKGEIESNPRARSAILRAAERI